MFDGLRLLVLAQGGTGCLPMGSTTSEAINWAVGARGTKKREPGEGFALGSRAKRVVFA